MSYGLQRASARRWRDRAITVVVVTIILVAGYRVLLAEPATMAPPAPVQTVTVTVTQ